MLTKVSRSQPKSKLKRELSFYKSLSAIEVSIISSLSPKDNKKRLQPSRKRWLLLNKDSPLEEFLDLTMI